MKRLILVAVLLLSGCTSLYHIGANVHDNGVALHRPVPKKVAGEMKDFEEVCVKAILNDDAGKIKDLAHQQLREKIRPDVLQEQLESMKSQFHLTGNFTRLQLHSTRIYMEEIISKDPYSIYEFIGCEYELKGSPNARVFLFIDKKTGSFRLWGFSVYSCDCKDCIKDITYTVKDIKKWWTFGD